MQGRIQRVILGCTKQFFGWLQFGHLQQEGRHRIKVQFISFLGKHMDLEESRNSFSEGVVV